MASIVGTEGADTLNGGADADTIEGKGGNDTINGGGGDDQITAGDGNDVVLYGPGQGGNADLGRGDDVFRILAGAPVFPTASGGEGVDTVQIDASHDLNYFLGNLTGFERLVVNRSDVLPYIDVIGVSGYQSIALVGSGSFTFYDSSNPDVDIILAGQTVALDRSSLRSITGGDGNDGVELTQGSVVSSPIALGAGTDQFTISLSGYGDLPRFPAIDGGVGDDRLTINGYNGDPVTLDLATVTGFEELDINTYSGLSAFRLSHVTGATSLLAGAAVSLTLSQTASPDLMVSGGYGGAITLDGGTVVKGYNDPFLVFGGAMLQSDRRDPSTSVAFTNNGTVSGDIDFWIGDDRYDGRLGSVGGTVHGNGGNDTLLGGAGNERLAGDKGDDVIDGGGGYDVALFAGTLAQSSVVRGAGGAFTVTGPDGTDRLSNVEAIQFSNGVLQLDSGIPVFDNLFYAQRNPDVFASGADLSLHYRSFGAKEGRDPNAFFSTAGYLAANPDIARAGADPLAHYDQQGWREGRDPSARFDTTLYLLHNPDVARAGVDPLAHYLTSGRYEGRQAYAAIGGHVMANGFDPDYYLLANPDVAKAGIEPYQHYSQIGWKEGRNPNSWFDDAGYLARYKDVADLGINPLQHYHDYGWKEGRDPSAAFDTKAYLAANPDVAQLHIDPLVHYLQYGAYEMRDPHSDGVIG